MQRHVVNARVGCELDRVNARVASAQVVRANLVALAVEAEQSIQTPKAIARNDDK